jgi:hypothetical protein
LGIAGFGQPLGKNGHGTISNGFTGELLGRSANRSMMVNRILVEGADDDDG